MATAPAPQNLSAQLANLIQTQLQALKTNPNLPKYDYSNLQGSVIDPQSFATNSTNAEYDPQIKDLSTQIAQATGQTGVNQRDIADWFKQAQNTYNLGAQNSERQYNNASSQLAGSAAGLLSALGGSANSANPGIAQQALIQQNMLAGNRQADVNLDQNMAGLIPLGAAQAHLNETGRSAKELDTLRSQLTGLKGAKGSAYAAALQSGKNTQFDQLNQLDSAKFNAANSIFNDVMSKRQANTSDAGTVMNAIITSMLAPGQMTAQNLANTQARANITATKAKTNAVSNPKVNLNNPADIQNLQSNLARVVLHSVVDANGTSQPALLGNPNKAWETVKGQLKNYGVDNAQGLAVARNWFKGFLPKGYYFDPKAGLTTHQIQSQRAAAAQAKIDAQRKRGIGSHNTSGQTKPKTPGVDVTNNPFPSGTLAWTRWNTEHQK